MSPYGMGVQTFHDKEPRQLLCAGSRAARAKITSGVPNCLNYCVILIVYARFANMEAGRLIQPGGPHETRGAAGWRPIP